MWSADISTLRAWSKQKSVEKVETILEKLPMVKKGQPWPKATTGWQLE
jgi:hypothetical protein